jgi:hypothetical protein
MKKLQVLLAIAVCGVLFGVTANVSAESANVGYATVVRVEGLVTYSLGNDQWLPLVSGKILPVGASIRTDYNGSVDIVLGKDINLPKHSWQGRWNPEHVAPNTDANVQGMGSWRPAAEQNVVRLSPNTTLAIDKLTVIDTGADTVSDTELNLKQGKIFASVKKITGASQYLIKLPNGIAGVRGTKFSIDIFGNVTDFESTGGGVVLSLVPPGGVPHTLLILPGFTFDAATGILSPNTQDQEHFLDNLFSALQTIYAPLAYVTKDGTCIYVSPTHGVGRGGSPPPLPE